MSKVRRQINAWVTEDKAARDTINRVNKGKSSPVIDRLLAEEKKRKKKKPR